PSTPPRGKRPGRPPAAGRTPAPPVPPAGLLKRALSPPCLCPLMLLVRRARARLCTHLQQHQFTTGRGVCKPVFEIKFTSAAKKRRAAFSPPRRFRFVRPPPHLFPPTWPPGTYRP